MIKKIPKYEEYEFWKDFFSKDGALTLYTSYVNAEDWTSIYNEDTREYTKTHDNWWTITARIHEDYYERVNEFVAIHPKFWKVWWDFEDKVYAEKKKWFIDFYKNFPPEAWDYWDI